MGTEGIELNATVDEDVRYLSSLMFRALHSLVKIGLCMLKNQEQENLLGMAKCQLEKARIPVVLWKVRLRPKQVFRVGNPGGPATHKLKVDDWRNCDAGGGI